MEKQKKSLLAFFAHPDDESFGPGGTLARYVREGVDVHIIIATDGAAGSVAEGYEEARERLIEVRAEELKAAVGVIGATLHTLNYQDSGYINDPANNHPDAFINCNQEEAVERMVALIRAVRPQVMITHDETGGYFHPDHIHCWKIGTAAFHAAADPDQFPHTGAAHHTQRLYYTAFPNRWIKFYTALMRLQRKDPTKAGRNNDIDMTKLGFPAKKIHARIDYRPYWEISLEASAKHGSQGGGAGFTRLIPAWAQKQLFGRDTFMRAHPPVKDGFRENDLFPNGVT